MMTVVTRSQEVATSALRSLCQSWQTVAGAQSAMGEVPDLVANYIDATRRILAGQRQLAATIVSAAQTAQRVTDQATRAAEEGLNALHAAANGMAGIAKAAGDQAAATASWTKTFTP
jgi:phosphoribosylcarboxyaminoimidazole (NCAIR) mutase